MLIGLFCEFKVVGQSFNELASGKTVIKEYSLEFNWSIAAPTQISGKIDNYIIDSNVGMSTVQIIVEKEEVKSIDEPLLFPNPVLGELKIMGADGWIVEFLDQQGKLHGAMDLLDGTNMVNTNTWDSGLYFARIRAGNEVFVKKILKVD